MSLVVETVIPVFAIVALGYWLAGRRPLDVGTLADVALMVTSPALVFSVLSRTALDPGRWALLAGGTAWICAVTGLLAWLYVRRAGPGLRGLVLPSVFWNAGNMGLPCARLAFGEPGLEAATLIFVALAILTFSFGIWVAAGRGGGGEVVRQPLVWAALAGLVVSGTGVVLPQVAREPVDMLAAMAIPLMLLNLGLQLRRLQLEDVRHAVVSVCIRIGGGVAAAAAFVAVLGVGGVERQVLLLAGGLPAAVMNVVLAQRYDASPTPVASAIVLSTLASLVSIPAILLWVT